MQMCTIEYGSLQDESQSEEIREPSKDDIQKLVGTLGKDVEYFHIHCKEGTLTVGCAGMHRAWVYYRRGIFQVLTLPQGWSNGVLLDDQYANSDETVDIISGGMPGTMLLYHTITKEVAQRTAEYFLEKQAFLEGYTWLQR